MSIEKIDGAGQPLVSGNVKGLKIDKKYPKSMKTWIEESDIPDPDGAIEEMLFKDKQNLNGDGVLSLKERLIQIVAEKINASKFGNQNIKSSENLLTAILKDLEDASQKIPPGQLLPSLSQLGLSMKDAEDLLEKIRQSEDFSTLA
jgi:hypothetical protein